MIKHRFNWHACTHKHRAATQYLRVNVDDFLNVHNSKLHLSTLRLIRTIHYIKWSLPHIGDDARNVLADNPDG